jgi:hypothetical protein
MLACVLGSHGRRIDPLGQQSAYPGHVPCLADEMEIIEYKKNPDSSENWMALCQGDTYSCEKAAGQQEQARCQKMESQMPE